MNSRDLVFSPWIVFPAGIVAFLLLARLARLRPGLRPLVAPVALTLVGLGIFSLFMGRLAQTRFGLLVLLVPAWVLAVRLATMLVRPVLAARAGSAPPALVETLVSGVLYAGAAAYVADFLGFNLRTVVATSAFLGAVLGLALQETLGNLFTGIALHAEAPFQVGDWVRVGDHLEGRVQQLSWRAVQMKTWSGDLLAVPHSSVARAPITNFSAPRGPHSRVVLVHASYDSPPNRVVAAIRRAVDEVSEISRSPEPNVRLIAYADSALTYEIRYWFESYEAYRPAESAVLARVWYQFRRSGIDVPFPIRDVRVRRLQPAESKDDGMRRRLARLLRKVEVLQAVPESDRESLLDGFKLQHFASGETIIEEGQEGDSFFLVDRGEASVTKFAGGARQQVASLRPGQFFGEMALLTGEARAASVQAITDVDVFVLDKAGFASVLAANPGVAEQISHTLAARQRALDEAARDATSRAERAPSTVELNQRILSRIREYFGL